MHKCNDYKKIENINYLESPIITTYNNQSSTAIMNSSLETSAIDGICALNPSEVLRIITSLFTTCDDFKTLLGSASFCNFMRNNFEILLDFGSHYNFIIPLSNLYERSTPECLDRIIDNAKLNVLKNDPFFKADDDKYYVIEVTDENAYVASSFLKEKCIRKVILYGSVTHLPSEFCAYNPTVTKITYFMPWLVNVGDKWMSGCHKLLKVNFKCLTKLKNVGILWMSECVNLLKVDFVGLENLRKVGKFWMSGCSAIPYLNFSPLINLTSVDIAWMSNCRKLSKLDINGLKSLEIVGDRWMYGCRKLSKLDCIALD